MAEEDAPAAPKPISARKPPLPEPTPELPILKPKPKPKRVKKPKPTHAVLDGATEVFIEDDTVIFYGTGRFKVHGHLRFAMTKDGAKALKKFLAKAL